MYLLSPQFVVEELENKLVLLDSITLRLYHLNDTASFIVKNLIKRKNREQIILLLIKKFDIAELKARKDVALLISDLRKKKIFIASEK